MSIEIILNNVLTALMRIHVSGEEAGMLDGAIQGLKQVLKAIEKAKAQEKEEAKHADCNE
ncbi:MAG: hypothetical protein J6V25_01850 [Oscillospiraceae bacterium]|nr:hypothetical protein [Oscillospiraceae bacterium]